MDVAEVSLMNYKEAGGHDWLKRIYFLEANLTKLGRGRGALGGACWGKRYREGKITPSSVFTPTSLLSFLSFSLALSYPS